VRERAQAIGAALLVAHRVGKVDSDALVVANALSPLATPKLCPRDTPN
jgi:hypothetical protein